MTSSWLGASSDCETPCSTGTLAARLGQLGSHLLVENVPVLPSSEKAMRSRDR
jgi:hypothetical protein